MPAVFPFRPNWRRAVLERLEWLTDVIESHNATEERIRLRVHPRRSLEYEILAAESEARRLDAFLWRHQAEQFLLPIWTDGQHLAAELAAGALAIPAATAGYDFMDGGRAVLFRDHETYEEVAIDTVTPDGLTLAAPTARTWAAGTRLFPARLARLPEEQRWKRPTAGVASGVVRLEIENTATQPQPDATLYQGVEVNLRRPNWIDDLDASYRRKIARHDYALGPVEVEDLAQLALPARAQGYLLESRADIAAFRGWLEARAGRANAFWAPAWTLDLEQAAPIAADEVVLAVSAIDYEAAYALDPNRRDLALRDRTGAWHFRRIESVAAGGPGVELLTLDAPLGIDAEPGELFLTWLVLSRLEADAVEIAWQTDAVATVTLGLRGLRA